jgi:transcriptional regulator with XRE-family HTH domain
MILALTSPPPIRMPGMTRSDDSPLGAFLRRAMKEAGLTQPQVAEVVGKSQSWTSSYLLANPEETIKRLWIKDPDTFDALCELLNVHKADVLRALGLIASGVVPESNARIIPLERVVRVYPAGAGPALDDETAVELVPIPRHIGGSFDVFGLKAEGESMSPYLKHGEIALIAAESGLAQPGKKIAVYMPDEGHQIKELVEIDDEGNIWLRSLNPSDGEPTVFRAPEGTVIKGRVIKRLKDD